MINLVKLRLIQMYRGIGTVALVVLVGLVIAFLLSGLYSNVEDSARLKVGIVFEKETDYTEGIEASLEDSEILLIHKMTKEDGLEAVKESRIEGLFVFHEDLEAKIHDGDLEAMVEVYFLDENYLPYMLTDLMGAELIEEIVLYSVIRYYDGAMEAEGLATSAESGDFERLYELGQADMHNEKDNFFVNQTYVGEDGSLHEAIELDNQLVFRQVILGVAYVFIAFYMMFLGVSAVRDRELGIQSRVDVTGISQWQVALGDYISLVVGAVPLVFVVTLLQWHYDGHPGYFILVNLLYVLAFAGVMNFVGGLFSKVTAYVLMSTALVLIMGVVSGSFFALDPGNAAVHGMTLVTPAYWLLKELTDMMVVGRTVPTSDFAAYMVLVAIIMNGASIWKKKIYTAR